MIFKIFLILTLSALKSEAITQDMVATKVYCFDVLCPEGYYQDPVTCECTLGTIGMCRRSLWCDESNGFFWIDYPTCACICYPEKASLVCPDGLVRDPTTCECIKACGPEYDPYRERCKSLYYEGFSWVDGPTCSCKCTLHADTKICPDGTVRHPTTCECIKACGPEYDPYREKCRELYYEGFSWVDAPTCSCKCTLHADTKICPDGTVRNPTTCECIKSCSPQYDRDIDRCKSLFYEGFEWIDLPYCQCNCTKHSGTKECPNGVVRDPKTCLCGSCMPTYNDDYDKCKSLYNEGWSWVDYPDCKCVCDRADASPCPDGSPRDPKTCYCSPTTTTSTTHAPSCFPLSNTAYTLCKLKYNEGWSWVDYPTCRCNCTLHADTSPCLDGRPRDPNTCLCPPTTTTSTTTTTPQPSCFPTYNADYDKCKSLFYEGWSWVDYPTCRCNCTRHANTVPCPDGRPRDPNACLCPPTTTTSTTTTTPTPSCFPTYNADYDKCKSLFYEGWSWVDYPTCRCNCTRHANTVPCPDGRPRDPNTCLCPPTTTTSTTTTTPQPSCFPTYAIAYEKCKSLYYEGWSWVDYPTCKCNCSIHADTIRCPPRMIRNREKCNCECNPVFARECINYQTFNRTSCTCDCDLTLIKVKCPPGYYFDMGICGCKCDKRECDTTKGWVFVQTPDFCGCKCDASLVPCPSGEPRDPNTCECPECIQTEPCPDGTQWYGEPICKCLCYDRCPYPQVWNFEKCQCECPNGASPNDCVNYQTWNPDRCACECPWYANYFCSKLQYLDPIKCYCPCKEPCHDCTQPQLWSDKNCDCRCPNKRRPFFPCASNRVWDDWTCSCKCIQKPRNCCAPKMNKMWSEKACNCICRKIWTCSRGMIWDDYLCKCVRRVRQWDYILNYISFNKDELVDPVALEADIEFADFEIPAVENPPVAIIPA